MIRNAAGKVMWVGRATVFLVGLAVILALVLGVATSALGANGKPFLLGKRNVASAVSTLVKRGAGPALGLRVGAGQPPLAVNSAAKVANLNADQLDGQDSAAYQRRVSGECPAGESIRAIAVDGSATCEPDNDGGAEVMDTVKANDGEGSGLDADTLDGKDSSQFASADLFGQAVSPNVGDSDGPQCILGEVSLFAGISIPKNWVRSDGQLLSIAENPELFTLVGTTYGGDGRSTFAVPDLRGAEPNGSGQTAPAYAICVSGHYPG